MNAIGILKGYYSYLGFTDNKSLLEKYERGIKYRVARNHKKHKWK